MPSRRDLIRMTPAEVLAYLHEQRRIIVVSIGVDGMPHPVPMNYGVDDEGRVVIATFAKSQKVKNLERDPRGTLLVESGDTYAAMRAVMAWCDAEIIRDSAEIEACRAFMRTASSEAIEPDSLRADQIKASWAKRVIVRFTPYRTASWDHAKLGQFY
jgi:nitroimidazol reductase NimA-like FMN-containing flavoprotein (pyridoxamine 5'-phosphate oxidase superfamily)